jgi:hypothetical protein
VKRKKILALVELLRIWRDRERGGVIYTGKRRWELRGKREGLAGSVLVHGFEGSARSQFD